MPGGFGPCHFSCSHCTCERHTGSLTASTLHFEALEAFAFFLLVTVDDLKVEKGLGRVGVDAVEHVLEHIEGLLLVLDKRILLPVADEADTLLYVVDR